MYKSSWPTFSDKMIENVTNVLRSGKVNQWTGSKVFEFEKKFAEYLGVNHAVAVFNGTVAIELCIKTLGLGKGDEIIVTPRTFIASASSINICGCDPIFVDVDISSQNITLENIQRAVTERTRAVILVHLAGWPCELEEIVEWCHQNNIYVIEDCAQSHGAKYKNKHVGTFGDINAWSFCQDKIMTTGGEGGMVTTNNTELYKKAWEYKDHGKSYDKMFSLNKNEPGMFRWVHDSIGTNWRMTEMQASIGIDAIEKLDDWVNIRRENAQILIDILSDNKALIITTPDDKYYHSYYKFYCFIDKNYIRHDVDRNYIIKLINEAGIPCSQGSCGEVYLEKAYGKKYDFPVTKKLSDTAIMLCVDPTYSDADMINIAATINNIMINVQI